MKRKSVATTTAARLRLRTLVALLSLSLLVLPAAANATPGGTAKLCRQGGWQHVQGTDGTRFANQAACVSYAAQGGMLVPIPPPAISAMVVTTIDTTGASGPSISITVTGQDFTPGGTGPIDTDFRNGFTLIDVDVTAANATGGIGPYTLNQGGYWFCADIDYPTEVTITATDQASGLIASTTVAVFCPQ